MFFDLFIHLSAHVQINRLQLVTSVTDVRVQADVNVIYIYMYIYRKSVLFLKISRTIPTKRPASSFTTFS